MEQQTATELAKKGFTEPALALAAYLLSHGWNITILSKHLAFTSPVKPDWKWYIGKRDSMRYGINLIDSDPVNDNFKQHALKEGRRILAEKGIK